jgi:hypothetical protein
MANFNNMNDLLKAIQNQVKDVANTEGKKTIKDTMKKHIQADVYDQYDPTEYDRRYDSTGGFLSDDSIDIDINSNGNNINITATDIATGNENYITADAIGQSIIGIIETGKGYTWKHSPGERPFLEKTKEDLENGVLEKSLKDGLKARGLKVK